MHGTLRPYRIPDVCHGIALDVNRSSRPPGPHNPCPHARNTRPSSTSSTRPANSRVAPRNRKASTAALSALALAPALAPTPVLALALAPALVPVLAPALAP